MRFGLVVLALLASCKDRDPGKPQPAPKPPEPEVACNPAQGTTCSGSDVVECTDAGQLGKKVQTCQNGCKRGACIDTCAAQGVELIYLVDSDNNFFSFDPKKLPDGDPFHQVGTLKCDRSSSPFSMAVDRHGVAWVGYDNGKVYRVSIIDARCMSQGAAPSGAPRTFGMGFVANDANTETLFVAPADGTGRLATLDTSRDPPSFAEVGDFGSAAGQGAGGDAQNPELTGTGDGKLFGYFPSPGFVTELDKATGKQIGPRQKLTTKLDSVEAYAFAHYGGIFYIFATNDGVNGVHAIHRKTGKYEVVLKNTPNRIVGAGVSTCAPLLERTEP